MKKAIRVISVLLAVMVLATSGVFAATDSKSKTVSYTGANYGEYKGYKATKKATFVGVKKSKRASIKVKKIGRYFKKNGVKYTVNKIAKNAFSGCKKLRKIIIYHKKAFSVQKGAFNKCNSAKIKIVCKKMSKTQFKKFKANLKKAGFKGKAVRG